MVTPHTGQMDFRSGERGLRPGISGFTTVGESALHADRQQGRPNLAGSGPAGPQKGCGTGSSRGTGRGVLQYNLLATQEKWRASSHSQSKTPQPAPCGQVFQNGPFGGHSSLPQEGPLGSVTGLDRRLPTRPYSSIASPFPPLCNVGQSALPIPEPLFWAQDSTAGLHEGGHGVGSIATAAGGVHVSIFGRLADRPQKQTTPVGTSGFGAPHGLRGRVLGQLEQVRDHPQQNFRLPWGSVRPHTGVDNTLPRQAEQVGSGLTTFARPPRWGSLGLASPLRCDGFLYRSGALGTVESQTHSAVSSLPVEPDHQERTDIHLSSRANVATPQVVVGTEQFDRGSMSSHPTSSVNSRHGCQYELGLGGGIWWMGPTLKVVGLSKSAPSTSIGWS